MKTDQSHPPALAIWFLRHTYVRSGIGKPLLATYLRDSARGAPAGGAGVKIWAQSWLALQAN